MSKKEKILLVDDEVDIIEILSYTLKQEGYVVYSTTNAVESINIAKKEIPNLIILDLMMPEMDGIEVCENIRKINTLKNTKIVFLSARNEDYSQIAAFNSGADDYITKPIKPKLLVSKIKALFRNTTDDYHLAKKNLVEGNFIINQEEYKVTLNGLDFLLPRKEFELLYLLASKPKRVFTRDEIFNKIWGNEVIVNDRTIDVHIRKLRKKLGKSFFVTIKGVGYKFEI
jgi:two-component system, OmpR family, alkaline phosphatase synthesis response regulator PhoP